MQLRAMAMARWVLPAENSQVRKQAIRPQPNFDRHRSISPELSLSLRVTDA